MSTKSIRQLDCVPMMFQNGQSRRQASAYHLRVSLGQSCLTNSLLKNPHQKCRMRQLNYGSGHPLNVSNITATCTSIHRFWFIKQKTVLKSQSSTLQKLTTMGVIDAHKQLKKMNADWSFVRTRRENSTCEADGLDMLNLLYRAQENLFRLTTPSLHLIMPLLFTLPLCLTLTILYSGRSGLQDQRRIQLWGCTCQ